MENYNQLIRNKVRNDINTLLDSGINLENCIEIYTQTFYQLRNRRNPHTRLYTDYLLYVMYLDAHKLELYKQKESITNINDTDFLGQILDVQNSKELCSEIYSDPLFLTRLIEECYKFEEINTLGKINIIKSLSSYENTWLLERFPIHQQDLDTYNININLPFLIENMKKQAQKQKMEGFFEFKEAIILSIVGFLRNLTNYDYENAEKVLLEIAQKDYCASKFLGEHFDENELFLDHIDLYENYSKRDILNELIENQEFLIDAVWNIADIEVYKEYNGMIINLRKIDDCKDTNVMKKLKTSNHKEKENS